MHNSPHAHSATDTIAFTPLQAVFPTTRVTVH